MAEPSNEAKPSAEQEQVQPPQTESKDSANQHATNQDAADQKAANRGRPHILDEARRREVCALVSAGGSVEWAAMYVGCSPSTIRRLARRDPEFNTKLREAALAAQLRPLNAMRHAATTHWRAAAWMLERLQPARYIPQKPAVMTKDQLRQWNHSFAEVLREENVDLDVVLRVLRRLNCEIKGYAGHL